VPPSRHVGDNASEVDDCSAMRARPAERGEMISRRRASGVAVSSAQSQPSGIVIPSIQEISFEGHASTSARGIETVAGASSPD